MGGEMVGSYEDSISEMANDFIEDNKEELTEIIKEGLKEEKTEEEIYDDDIYQEWDLIDKIHEFLDREWFSFLREDWLDDCKTELSSCARILDFVKEEETDSGLWEGQQPEQAIMTKAFFSVRNDLYWEIEKRIKEMISNIHNSLEK